MEKVMYLYEDQVLPSLESARVLLPHLWKYMRPRSVLDVGCGRGAWVAACHELGSTHLFGLDGDWNHQDQMIDKSIQFRGVDLTQAFTLDRKVDLSFVPFLGVINEYVFGIAKIHSCT